MTMLYTFSISHAERAAISAALRQSADGRLDDLLSATEIEELLEYIDPADPTHLREIDDGLVMGVRPLDRL
jgi:hypothetical protein